MEPWYEGSLECQRKVFKGTTVGNGVIAGDESNAVRTIVPISNKTES